MTHELTFAQLNGIYYRLGRINGLAISTKIMFPSGGTAEAMTCVLTETDRISDILEGKEDETNNPSAS